MYSEYYNSQANKAVPADPKDKPYYTPLNGDEAITKTTASNDPDIKAAENTRKAVSSEPAANENPFDSAAERAAEQKQQKYAFETQILTGTLSVNEDGNAPVSILVNQAVMLQQLLSLSKKEREKRDREIRLAIEAMNEWLDEMLDRIEALLDEINEIDNFVSRLNSYRNNMLRNGEVELNDDGTLKNDEMEAKVCAHEKRTNNKVDRSDITEMVVVLDSIEAHEHTNRQSRINELNEIKNEIDAAEAQLGDSRNDPAISSVMERLENIQSRLHPKRDNKLQQDSSKDIAALEELEFELEDESGDLDDLFAEEPPEDDSIEQFARSWGATNNIENKDEQLQARMELTKQHPGQAAEFAKTDPDAAKAIEAAHKVQDVEVATAEPTPQPEGNGYNNNNGFKPA